MRNMRGMLIALAVVLVALIALNQLTSRQRLSTVEGGGFAEVLPAGFDPEAVHSITAYLGSAPDSTVALEREGDGWIVTTAYGWPARDNLVDRLFTDLGELRAELRSSDEDVLGDYEIGDDEGLHVVGRGSGGSEIFHLVAGKNAERGGSFIRREGSSRVAYTKKTLRSHFGIWSDPAPPEARRWLDLQLHRVDRTNVDEIRLRDGGEEIVLTKVFETPEPAEGDTSGVMPEPDRNTWTWAPDGGGEIQKSKADAILGLLSSLNATRVVDPDSLDAYGLVDATRVAEIVMHDAATTRIAFGHVLPADSTAVYVRVDEGKPAAIAKNTVDRIFVAREDLSPTDES
jgi:hypothetical protein